MFYCKIFLNRSVDLLYIWLANFRQIQQIHLFHPQILNHTNPRDSFIKCMYFYVITLTTVGLGDISMTEAQPFVLIRVLFVFCVGTCYIRGTSSDRLLRLTKVS